MKIISYDGTYGHRLMKQMALDQKCKACTNDKFWNDKCKFCGEIQ